jgi:ribosomal protein L3 glutamine methyltransferase
MWREAAGRLRTPRDLLRFAVSRFNAAQLAFGHGSDNAYDEAAYLILHTLHLPLDRLEPFLDAELLAEEVVQVLSVLERRVTERIPAAYLTNEAWLGDYRFYVDARVIVPRSHIAALLEPLNMLTDEPDAVQSALDLCTGSGCLAILMGQAFPNAAIDAIDISAEALQVAERNVTDYALGARIRLLKSDLFAALGDTRYDVIVSNPPYVTAAAMQSLPPEYRHEPADALAAGIDGLDIVRRILREAKRWLKAGGILVVEVGDAKATLKSAFPGLPFTWLETGDAGGQVFLLEREQLPG